MKTALFSLFISICVAVLSLFQFEKYQKFSYETQASLKKLDGLVTSRLDDFRRDLDKIASQEQALQAQSQAQLQAHAQAQAQAQNQNQSSTWMLAEAESLANSAAIRLSTLRDVKSATTLLSLALDKVQAMHEPRLSALQVALNADLTALKNVQVVNTTELWLKITALIEASNKLPVRTNPRSAITESTDTTSTESKTAQTEVANSAPIAETNPISTAKSDSWKETFVRAFSEFKDLIKIRHHTKPIEPLLTAQEQVLAKENLRLMLEQTRFALLNSEMIIYRQSIQEVQQWIDQYFDKTNENVKEVQNALMALAAVNFQPELPSLTQSLDQFNALKQ